MKKLIILIFLFVQSACNSYDVYKKEHGDANFKLLVMFQSWVENPGYFIENISPATLVPNDEFIYNIKLHKEQQLYLKRKHKVEAMQQFWIDFFNNLSVDTIEKYSLKFYFDKDYRSVKCYSALDNVYYGVSIGILLHNGITQLNIKRIKKPEHIALSGFSANETFASFYFKGKIIFLNFGDYQKGLIHIIRRHAPKFYIERNMKVPENTSLFLRSTKKYVQLLIDDFVKSPYIYEAKSYNPNYLVYEGKSISHAGIYRYYRLVIDKQTNDIITFHPLNKVDRIYLGNKFKNYQKLRYGK